MRSILKAFVFFLLLGVALSSFSQIKAGNRITQSIDDRDTIELRGSVHPMLRKATDQGRMDGATRLEGVSLVFKRTAEQDAAAAKFLEDVQNPNSPGYHKWLTPEQYADRFGVSAADLSKVTAWLQSQGFTVNRTGRGRTQVWFSGTVGQIETVFRTEMHHFDVKGEAHFANSVEPSIPSALGEVVLGVHGLSNFRPKPRMQMNRALAETVKPNFTFSGGLHFMSPDDWTTIYDVKALYTAGFDGTGQAIAVAGQSEVNNADLDAFRTASGLPARTASNFVRQLVPSSGTATVVSGDVGESSIDLEWSHAVAKGAKIIFVYVGNSANFNVFDAFTYAIDQNLAPILSMSYGNCEQNLPSGFLTAVQQSTQQAAMQGQTIAAASGDFGAADCDTAPGLPAQGGLGVDIPGALPYVTSVGGTGFNGDVSSPATFWNASNNGVNGSAKSYIGEATWNDTILANALSAGGGGASVVFSKPSWQTGAGVPNDGARDVPDIALAASPNHDGYMVCVNDPQASPPILPCTSNGFLDSSGGPNVFGGTSFGSPTFSGIVAILNQKTGSRQGNINPALYELSAANVGAFHDITSGSNIVPCDRATADCPQSGTAQYGFSAGAGYDQVTGLGSIDAAVLVNNWSSANSTTADFTMFGHVVGIASAGGSGSSTITVDARNGYSGTINFTCAAPASAKIGCTVSGGPITLNATTKSGTVTVSITTTAGVAPNSVPLWLSGSGALFAGVLLFGIPSKRRRLSVALTLITVALILAAVGCGGSSSSGGGGGNGTPVGSYVVSVTGTDGTTSHTANVSVAVQ